MIRISVPATSANLGAGFDCMGLALPIRNEIEIERWDKLEIETDPGLPANEDNLVIRAMRAFFAKSGNEMPTVRMKQVNRIPCTSGLGSSAACIVAGILAANALAGRPLDREEMIDLATELDGHPDNVAPAFMGGITASVSENGRTRSFRAEPSDRYRVALLTPEFQLPTSQSRAVLPQSYLRADAVYNLAHAVATFAAFSVGDPERIGAAIGDRMHERYRLPLIPGADRLISEMKRAGAYGTYLSGAGPTLAGIVPPDFGMSVPSGWTLRVLPVSERGADIEEN